MIQLESISVSLKCARAKFLFKNVRVFKNLMPVTCAFQKFNIGEINYDEYHMWTPVLIAYAYEIYNLEEYDLVGYEWCNLGEMRITLASKIRPRSK
jgi:hypothetical protein